LNRVVLGIALPAALIGTLAAAAPPEQSRPPAARPPNVVFITIDTLRADHLECYGYKRVRTPHINALAADGVLVERAYTPIPLTLPSHASIFTGTYPLWHGVRDFTGFTLSKDRKTLATLLKSAGYRTGAVIGSAVLEARWGLAQGFDAYYDNVPVALDREWQPIAERRGDVVVREGLRWLEANKGGPFLLWLHLFDPHDPYEPPAPYGEQYRERPYDGEIAYTDSQVGAVLDYLKRSGLYTDALVVLLADHGESLGEHGEKTHGFFIYDATLRIPMIFKLPGASAPRGARISGPLRTIDVLPTTLQILGLTDRVRASEVQGTGAYAAFLGKPGSAEVASYAELFLPFYHFEWSPLLSIRRGRHKLIDAPRPELYDTVADPGETRNVAGEQAALAGQLRALLGRTVQQYAAAGAAGKAPAEVDAATLERLQSLGYLAASRGVAAPPPGKSLPDPKDRIEVYELIHEGTRAAQRKDYGAAVRDLTEAVRREPGSLIGTFQLGNVYRVAGDLPGAERAFLRTLQLKPDHTLAWRRLAEIYLASKRYPDAEAAYKKVVAQSPRDFIAWFNLGGLYVTEDRWEDALTAFRKAQESNPSDSRVPLVIARIRMRNRDLPGALEAVEQALRIDPNLAEAHQTALQIYQLQGRKADAEREAQVLERLRKTRARP
jgi:arylsulfatase A-like enzyme/cytochrome c-type biogenesis protein CcmH/NrfG